MAADHITWANYRNNATFDLISSFLVQSGELVPNMQIHSVLGGNFYALLADTQSKPRKVLLFLGFCYNSRQQER